MKIVPNPRRKFLSHCPAHHNSSFTSAIGFHQQRSGRLIGKGRRRHLDLSVLLNPLPRIIRRRSWLAEAIVLASMFVAVLITIRAYSTDIVGGSDSYGYVSAALRLSRGRIWQHERVFSLFGLPENSRISHPLGEKEKGSQGTVPTYPLGYPLLMALFIRLFGLASAFWVTPLLSAGTVVLTYLLGSFHLGRIGGGLAASLVFILPNFLWCSFQPLSDVPTTFFTVVGLLALMQLRSRPWIAVLGGIALGYGVLVRPNIMILIVPIAAWLAARRKWKNFLRLTSAVIPFLALQGIINAILYGSPWKTGYGSPPLGDNLAGAAARAWDYLMNLNMQQAWVGLSLAVLGFLLACLPWDRKALLGGIPCMFLVFFSFYRIGDAWWYGRFLLPVFPAVAVLEAAFFLRLLKQGRLFWLRVSAVITGLIAFVWLSLGYAQHHNTFTIAEDEARYPKAAKMVLEHVQRPAIVVAMQHSGSVRFYTDLPTTRYDVTSILDLLVRLRQVEAAAGNVYLLAEPWEVERISKGKAAPLLVGAERMAQVEPNQVILFRLTPSASAE